MSLILKHMLYTLRVQANGKTMTALELLGEGVVNDENN